MPEYNPKSFIQNFMLYNSGNECPKPYVLWTAYGLLSAAIGHRLWLDLEYFFVRCDTYILLIGPSGGRKTASMILGLDMLKEALPDVILSGDNETYQGIISFLHSDDSTREYTYEGRRVEFKPYSIFSEELMDYIQLNPIAMVTFLTNIYGKKSYRYRLKNEESMLNNPYVTMCACSVPEWLTDQLKAKQFAEGYGRRTILVCHAGIVRKKPTLSEASKVARDLCIQRLKEIRNIVGPAVMEKDAHDYFWKWYVTQKDPAEAFLKNWYSTRHINLLKVAMLSSISERDDKVVTLNHIKLAEGLILEVEKNIPMVTDIMGRNETAFAMRFVLDLLRQNGGKMSEKELRMKTLKEFKNPMEQFSTFMHLKSVGMVVEITEKENNVEKKYLCLPKIIKPQ